MVEMINNGHLIRILTPYYHLGQDNTIGPPYVNDTAGYRNVEIGMSSVTVLLKNTGGLPLKKPKDVAETDATDNMYGANSCGATNSACLIKQSCAFYALTYSPYIYIITPLDALKQRAIQDNTEDSNFSSTAEAAIATMLPSFQWGEWTLRVSTPYRRRRLFLVAQGLSTIHSSNVVVLVIHATGGTYHISIPEDGQPIRVLRGFRISIRVKSTYRYMYISTLVHFAIHRKDGHWSVPGPSSQQWANTALVRTFTIYVFMSAPSSRIFCLSYWTPSFLSFNGGLQDN
ncbi:hypothetical protein F5050DRAFT_1771512 [Lentinula boryana]|uniref:Uncharacterized protein n=1 Tax=Lentinula boryana TaxID=40481 RepID=A0ABQ8Q8D5_9AGAR|nr:hypothetical protein F5050DRAFT_1771512 [Lentinula boryana]